MNDLQAIMALILARALMVLRPVTAFPRLVNTDYSAEAQQQGDVINIPIPTAVGVRDVSPSNIPPNPTLTNTNKVQVELKHWRQSDPIYLTDKEMAEIQANRHFLPMQMGEAVKALTRDVNQKIVANYKKVYNFVGDPTQIAFGATRKTQDATDARKKLNENFAPKDQRYGVIDHDVEAQMLTLPEFADADKVGDPSIKMEGEIGRKFGINWVSDDDVPTHITGAATGTAIAVDSAGGYAAGISTIHIDGLTSDPVEGDIFTFAGHNQQYVVLSTSGTGAELDVVVSPALAEPVADDEVLTFVPDHKVNLVFHRDAFVFASRSLMNSQIANQTGVNLMTMEDPTTGLVLRLEIKRQHKQEAWELDILYGTELVRPELATRLISLA